MGGCSQSVSKKKDQTGIIEQLKEDSQAPNLRRLISEKLGYQLEKHHYYTKDGCINTVFRIPGPKNKQVVQLNQTKKPVAIYQHGLLDCCAGIICDEEDSLGLKLVNQGFDLWLNNSRGNRFSRDHQLIDINNCSQETFNQYYSFSFSEMAEFDQPALWEYIIKVTGVEKITYIGHSQGTTQMFASLSLYPEFYQKHMIRFVAVAPVIKTQNLNSKLLQSLKDKKSVLDAMKNTLGMEVLTMASMNNVVTATFLKSALGAFGSGKMIGQVSDGDPSQMSQTAQNNYFKFFPAGTSFQCIDHFKQMMISGEFHKYDYENEQINIQKYGQPKPPLYNLQNIKGFKISLICGQTDLLASPVDYVWTKEMLEANGNLVDYQEYTHGHLGLIMPNQKDPTQNMLKIILSDYQ